MFLFTLCIFIFLSRSEVSSERLLQVNIVYRHGDRSPFGTYPTDPHQAGTWPRGFAQLSKRGQKRQLELGKFFRRRYGKFLGQFYQPDIIRIQSTDKDRTLMSAASNCAGLFPPNPNEEWTTEIKGWQPIPIHTLPFTKDNLLTHGHNCDRYLAMWQELWTTRAPPEVLEEKTKYAAFWDEFRRNAGYSPDKPLRDLWFIADILYIERSNNLTLPSWVTQSIYEHLIDVYHGLQFKILFYNRTMVRLAGGNLLNEMRENMMRKLSKLADDKPKRVYVYSAHDNTVAALLATLKLFNNLIPPYASAVMVELWENDAGAGPFVRVYFRNDTSITPRSPLLLTIPGCGTDCPWSQFLQLTQDAIPEDYEQECQLPLGMTAEKRPRDSLATIS